MGEHIERLAQFVAQTQWEDIPAPVQRHTKLVLLDTLGVILAARGTAVARASGGDRRHRRHGLCARLAHP